MIPSLSALVKLSATPEALHNLPRNPWTLRGIDSKVEEFEMQSYGIGSKLRGRAKETKELLDFFCTVVFYIKIYIDENSKRLGFTVRVLEMQASLGVSWRLWLATLVTG